MRNIRFIFLAVPFLIVACGAKGPEGKWTGKISVDATKVDAKMKPQVEVLKSMFEKASMSLELKADKTGSIGTTGMGPDQTDTIKWSAEGKVLSVTPSKGKLMTMKLSDDGKTLTADLPGGSQGMALSFTRVEGK